MIGIDGSGIATRLSESFGAPIDWSSKDGVSCRLWPNLGGYEVLFTAESLADGRLRRTLEDRRGRRATAVVLLTLSDDADKVRVVGPLGSPLPVRDLSVDAVIGLIGETVDLHRRDAVSTLERELRRLEESVLPGIRVKELLTPHYIRTRLPQRPRDKQRLEGAVTNITGRIGPSQSWQTLLGGLGYDLERRPKRGYVLRHEDAAVAVVHPMKSTDDFSRMNDVGELPDGLLLRDCEEVGANWGILVAGMNFRILQADPHITGRVARYVEIDAGRLKTDGLLYLGMLSPASMKRDGWLTEWTEDARDFGEELRKGLEDRIRTVALPKLAQGIGRYLESEEGVDLRDREMLREIEEAVLTLVFRFMFLLHVEARGYLPVRSRAYYPHSARKLADDCRLDDWELDSRSTELWGRLCRLFSMIRNGDASAGVPHYNGSLFAPDRFPGAELLERVEISDRFLAPAIESITFEPDKSEGLDYAGLQIGHLGAIYEALLGLRLTRAIEPLAYDSRRDTYRPISAGEEPEVVVSELFYQTEAGGRKAGGVYYTRHEFVEHLLNHSLKPALDAHLEKIRKLERRDPKAAARELFDFYIVDPAMGSGHFLTRALDMMADEIELFLADVKGLPSIKEELDELRRDEKDDGLASVEDVDLLRRLILKRCIYGVDLSPMAVEVANVTLWLASFVPGLALSYLGSNLKCGDALIGVADTGVVVGDVYRPTLFTGALKNAISSAAGQQRRLSEIPDVTPEEVKRSEELDDEIRVTTSDPRRAFDLWCAEPLGLEGGRETLEYYAEEIVKGEYVNAGVSDAVNKAGEIADQYRFFHWPLEFPHVFDREGRVGFDVVMGNPPWEKVKVEDLAFYALHDPGLRGIIDLHEQRKRINELDRTHPEIRPAFESFSEEQATKREFFGAAGGYVNQGVGDTDLYRLFCERYAYLTRRSGYMGVVLPSSTFVNKGSAKFREWLFTQNSVRRIDTIRNTRHWAFPIHAQFSIALLTSLHEPYDGDLNIRTTGPATSLDEFLSMSQSEGVSIPFSIVTPFWEIPRLRSNFHANVLTKIREGVEFEKLIFSRQESKISS